MSRFFATGSDSETESSSSEEEQVQQRAPAGASAFTFSDEEEETKRVVRSTREKRYEELTDIIKQIKNHKKIKDMSKLLTSFENLIKAFQKAKPVVDKEEGGATPKFYLRCLVELEDFINDCWEDREGRKNMSKNNSKSLATLRQKLRKYNKDFEVDIASYRENPDIEEEDRDEDDMESDESDRDDFMKKPTSQDEPEDLKSKFTRDSEDEDSDEDSIDWGSTSEEESSSSSDDEKYGGNLAAKFLKKSTDKEDQEQPKERKKKREKERRDRRREDDEGEWEEVKGGVPLIMEKPKMFAKDAEINHQAVVKKFNEILAARGKKGTDRSEQIELLIELMNISHAHDLGPATETKILFAIIGAIYDYNPNIATCMKPEMWQKCLEYIGQLFDTLLTNPTITVGEHIAEESETLASPPYRVRGCVLTLIERMDEEFIKMLQGCDAHSPEYVERLKDEKAVCKLIEKLQGYLEGRGSSSELCRIYLRRIEHLYYKFDANVFKWKELRNGPKQQSSEPQVDGEVDGCHEKCNGEKPAGEELSPPDTSKAVTFAEELSPPDTNKAVTFAEELLPPDTNKTVTLAEELSPPDTNKTVTFAEEISPPDTNKTVTFAEDAEQDVVLPESPSEQDVLEGERDEKEAGGEEKDLDEADGEPGKGEDVQETSLDVIDRLCKYIYAKDNTDRIRTQAMLCHVYHHALHNNWFEARDLMLMSHLQDTIHHADIPTHILYNRALVQLGLCAFRHGSVRDAHNALLDIQSGGRAKELLAQGLLPQRQHERTSEQEKIEKRRQMPFHKHINLELLECVYLVSAMLLEIPYMAAHELEGRKRMISKSFHHQLRNSERQPLVGPPESMREHVVAASKAMRVGNWRSCKNYIINEKMNAKVWDLFHQADKVRDLITQKIQEEALRTYLFTYSSVYDSISMETLAEMFELDKSIVHSIISKMIINEELMASLDEPTLMVVMHRTEPSRIQALSLQLADKVINLMEQNERICEIKQGSFFGRGLGQQGSYRDTGYQKGSYSQQDRGWGKRDSNMFKGRRTGQRNY